MSVLALLRIPSGWMGQSLNPEDAPRALVAGQRWGGWEGSPHKGILTAEPSGTL